MNTITIRRYVEGKRSRAEIKATEALIRCTEVAGMAVIYYAVGPDSVMAVLGSGSNFLLYGYDRHGRLHEINRPKEGLAAEIGRLREVRA